MKFLLLFIMIFCHIVDDYYLQKGLLANLKQREWWETNAPDPMYKNDYKAALLAHSFSWAFMILLPLLVFMIINGTTGVFILFGFYIPALIYNTLMHYSIDNEKANKHSINLITDQICHMLQIGMTYIWFYIITLI